jgi:transcriptional regulator with XRE-family HTH domain
MKIDKKELGKAIAYARMIKGLNPQELGEEFDLTGQAIAKWENGQSAPSVGRWQRLKDVLGVDAMAYQTVGNKNRNTTIVGHGATMTQALSAEEQMIIKLLREKDTDGTIARRILAELLHD